MEGRVHRFREIGIVRSCFGQRFAIPRQSGLAPSARGRIEIHRDFAIDAAFRGIEAFSHVWVVWVFHANRGRAAWRPTVRPPRFHGRRRFGVFATRSPYRPNPLALSAVRLLAVRREEGRLWLEVGGIDMLDGSPVLDIKPYIPYADRLEDATAGFTGPETGSATIRWTPEALAQVLELEHESAMPLRSLVEELLGQDPRPSRTDARDGLVMRIHDLDLRWHIVDNGELLVTSIEKVDHAIGGNL